VTGRRGKSGGSCGISGDGDDGDDGGRRQATTTGNDEEKRAGARATPHLEDFVVAAQSRRQRSRKDCPGCDSLPPQHILRLLLRLPFRQAGETRTSTNFQQLRKRKTAVKAREMTNCCSTGRMRRRRRRGWWLGALQWRHLPRPWRRKKPRRCLRENSASTLTTPTTETAAVC